MENASKPMHETKTMRVVFDAVAKQAGGRFSIYNRGDLARVCGLRKGASPRAWAGAALANVAQWQYVGPRGIRIGDVVAALYHGTVVVGRLRSFDSSGYVYLDRIAPGSCAHDGRDYEGVALCPAQRKSMIKIGRKPYRRIEDMGIYGVSGFDSERAEKGG